MLDAEPSRTALMTAFLRAVHVRIDDQPPVLDDHLAYALLPPYQRRFIDRIEALSAPWHQRFRQRDGLFTSMRAHICVRARYAEDALERARENGATRYVVLAAGLDTFAMRQTAPPIAVVEVDHPATQQWKRELLAERGVDNGAAVTYLPVNFEHEALADRWPDHAQADFISWLGVTYYLTREAIVDTLRVIAERSQPGTEMVLDYWSRAPLTQSGGRLLWTARIAVAMQQEPMHSFFSADEIAELAVAAGWRVHENCSPEAQNARYLAARGDRLTVPSFAGLLHLKLASAA